MRLVAADHRNHDAHSPVTTLGGAVFLFGVILCTAFAVSPAARAYQVTGMRYDHTAITYSCGDDTLRGAVQMWANVSGLEDGGCSENPDIVLYLPSVWEYPQGTIGWAAYTSTDGHTVVECTVAIRKDAVGFIGVYVHEVGHCLGSSHSENPESAMAPYCCHWLSPDDVAMIQSIYGAQQETSFRRLVPMVATD